jgi:hypothetical protein
MKRHTLLFLSIVLLLGSCTKDLVPLDYSEINPSIFPKSAADLEAMVNAAYHPVRGSYGDGIFSTSEKGVMYISDATTETLYGTYGDQQIATLHNYRPENTAFTHYYDDYNNKISRMTTTIDLIQNSTVGDDLKRRAIAQVRCARGLLAYTLFDLYGPLVIAPLDVLKDPLKEEPLARLTNQETVDFITADLVAAAADLPGPAEAEYGRFNKALAKMLLIRLNLHEKKWDNVVTLANEIIAYNKYILDADYVAMWDLEGAKNSKEVIWAIPCDYAGTSENQWQLMVLPAVFSPKGGFGTILISEFTGTDGISYSRANPGTLINFGPIPLKMNQDAARTTGVSTVDIVMYRYADVLLSKAEALANQSAPTQEAMDLVNMVRRRAGLEDKALSGYTGLAAFNDLILTERSHEFWCENGQYRADLIRMGKFVSRTQEVKKSTYTAPYKVLFPFSPARIAEGKGKFIQNTGYN